MEKSNKNKTNKKKEEKKKKEKKKKEWYCMTNTSSANRCAAGKKDSEQHKYM